MFVRLVKIDLLAFQEMFRGLCELTNFPCITNNTHTSCISFPSLAFSLRVGMQLSGSLHKIAIHHLR